MKESLSIFITTIILVLLIVVFPLYNYFEREDDMSYNLVLKATTSFIDEVIYCGYISQEMYTDYISEIANTGNLYDIELEAHKRVLVKKDGLNEYEEQYLIDYNNDIFSSEVTNSSNINDKIIKNGVYHLNVGDKIYIKLKNSNVTMAGALFNIIVPASSQKTIKINYGGIIKNNTWQQADTPLFEEFQIKLAFDLNTNGDNNANYNNDTLRDGIVNKLYTGTKYTTFTIPNAVPTRTNCTFKYWSTTKNGTVKKYYPNDQVKIDESLVLYAVWQYNPITLTLNANGGTPATQSKTLTYGGKYIALSSATKPTMTGYTFEGWYTAANGGTKVTSNTNVNSTNNVTLYAHWKAVQMTVTLDANGGSVSPSSFTGTYKQKYGSLPNPTRTGYTFNGWYLDSSYTTKVTESTTINTGANHTLYAKWTANTYTITYNGNGGNSTTRQRKYDETLGELPKSVRSGYTFNGWYTAVNNGPKISENTEVKGDITYYAHWTLNTYTITYNLNGGTASNPTSYNITTSKFTLSNPTRTGYTFTGWTGSNGTTPQTSVSIESGSTGNKSYTANWKANTYTIKYDSKGGSSVASQKKTYGSTLDTLPSTTKSGYTFNGWYTAESGGDKISSSTRVTGNVTYYAQWTPIDIGKVTITPSTTEWTNQDVTVTLSHTAVSGYTLQYKIGSSGTWTNYTSAITVSTNATTIYGRMYNTTLDNEGNSANSKTISNIDKTKPTISNISNSSNSNLTNQNVTISFNYNDTGSGVNTSKIVYSYDKSNTYNDLTINESSEYVSGVWTAEWNNHVWLRITDNVGNVSDWYDAGWVRITGVMELISPISITYPYREETSTCCGARISRATEFNVKCSKCGRTSTFTIGAGLDWCSSCGNWISGYSNGKAIATSIHYLHITDGGYCRLQ